MRNSNINIRKLTVFSIVVIVLIIVISLGLDKLIFRQTRSDQNLNSIATSSTLLKLSFSQPLQSVGKISINNNVIDGAAIDGSTITIPFQNVSLIDGTTYTLQLKDIHSKWFNNKIMEIKTSFTAKYTEYGQLSKEQQKTQVSQSDSGQINDPFLNNAFPLLDPELKYQINANNNNGVVNVNVTFLDEVPNYDESTNSIQLPDSTAEEYRKQALQKIKNSNGNPDKYIIIYSNNYLNNKYPTDYHD